MDEKLAAFKELLTIMDELRAKCPWDKKQTFETLRKLTIEETYELADAIIEKDLEEIKNELGDLMLHIVFYAKIGSEKKAFDMKDVLESINKKLIFRHPHVFGDTKVNDEEDVKANWEQLKIEEGRDSVLGGVPKSLPAMIKANRIQEKVRSVLADFFQFFDNNITRHNIKEEKLLFPLLRQRYVETGEHSKSQEQTTAVDMLEDDHIKFIQIAAITFTLFGLIPRLPDHSSRNVVLDLALEQGKTLIEQLRLHIFREDKVVFPFAQKNLTKDEVEWLLTELEHFKNNKLKK